MTAELVRDLDRPDGWWLLVDGSEQSYVDTADPTHLEFEYVQMVSHVLETVLAEDAAVDVLHLGGGLLTVPRWLAARRPGSRQHVVERSARIAEMADSLGTVDGVVVEIADVRDVLPTRPRASADVIVCDVYDGPETVTSLFTLGSLQAAKRVLRPDGLYVCNLSDATPFDLSRTVAATLRLVFESVTVLGEPSVLRGRRTGNLVLAGTDGALPLTALARRAAGAPVRVRVMPAEIVQAFVGDAPPATAELDLPPSGESAQQFR